MNHHLATPPPSISEFRSDLPPELAAAVDRAIAKDRADRFQTAKDFGAALQLVATNAVTADATGATPPDPHARAAASGVRRALAGEPAEVRGSRSGALLLIAAALAAIALAASTLFPWAGRPTSASRADPAASAAKAVAPNPGYSSSIAVMPLATYGADSQSAFLSEGLTEEIITQLARIKGLKVISRTSVVALASKGLTVPQIADTLGVRHVLEGSVQRSADRIRVTLQLIDAQTDAHLWAESYDRSFRDVIALRQEIAGKVAGALAMAVPGVEASRAKSPETSAAYEAYLRGSYWLGRISPEGIDQAIKGFEDAIRADSTYAPAYAGLSTALQKWVGMGVPGEREPYATFARAAAMAERALVLDSTLVAGYLARAVLRIAAWAPDSLIRVDVDRAMASMPNSGGARMARALSLAREGRYPEAVAESETAVQLDPLSADMHAATALTALGARRYDLAVQESRRTLSLDPQFVGGKAIDAVALLEQGRADRCLALDLGAFPEVRAMCLQASGQTSEAAALADSLSTAYRSGGAPRLFQLGLLAAHYARLGDSRRAAQWLERAFTISPNPFEFRVIDSGLFDRARDDPEFRATLARLHRQVYQRVFR